MRILLLLLLVTSLAQAEQGLLLIYDSRNDHSVEVTLRLTQQLKSLRTSGHFAPAQGFSTKFATADLNVPAYAGAMKSLGLKAPIPLPYLAVCSLANGQPKKVLWGQQVHDVNGTLAALDTRLGLQPAPAAADTPPPWAQEATQDTSREALTELLLRVEQLNQRTR